MKLQIYECGILCIYFNFLLGAIVFHSDRHVAPDSTNCMHVLIICNLTDLQFCFSLLG